MPGEKLLTIEEFLAIAQKSKLPTEGVVGDSAGKPTRIIFNPPDQIIFLDGKPPGSSDNILATAAPGKTRINLAPRKHD